MTSLAHHNEERPQESQTKVPELVPWARVTHQCAWCGRIVDARRRPLGKPLPPDPDATHSICAPCSRAEWARYMALRKEH